MLSRSRVLADHGIRSLVSLGLAISLLGSDVTVRFAAVAGQNPALGGSPVVVRKTAQLRTKRPTVVEASQAAQPLLGWVAEPLAQVDLTVTPTPGATGTSAPEATETVSATPEATMPPIESTATPTATETPSVMPSETATETATARPAPTGAARPRASRSPATSSMS